MAESRNYFDYFPLAPKWQAWGVASTSFGTVRVPAGAPYPPAKHPGSHHLAWEKGRVLSEYQILYIHRGRGQFESARTKTRVLTSGTAFILFPRVWHRYRPDPGTGWEESWIEMKGSLVDRLRRVGIIDPRRPIYPASSVVEIERFFETAASLARRKPPGFTVRLGLLALEILALLSWKSGASGTVPGRMDQLISESQAMLAGDLEGKLSLEQIARELGAGYSRFRRQFKAQTGLSPKQYRIELRHHRAREMLLNSSRTVKEIAEQLGYSSPFHLSQEFSRIAGASPQRWRGRAMRTSR